MSLWTDGGGVEQVDLKRESDILNLQLDSVEEMLGADQHRREHELAALMLQWHATYYYSAFDPVAERCEEIVDRARLEQNWEFRGYIRCAPLLLALELHRCHPFRLEYVPDEIERNLWHDNSSIRAWMMECVYWASPRIPAASLIGPYLRLTERHYLYRDWLALLIALCAGGSEALAELEERLPSDEWIPPLVKRVRLAEQIENPFAHWAGELYGYMFRQTVRLEDDAEREWFLLDAKTVRERRRLLLGIGTIDRRCEQIAGPYFDMHAIEQGHREDDQPAVLAGPLTTVAGNYRLVQYADESVGVEHRIEGSSVWIPTDKPSVAEFTQMVLGSKKSE